MSSAAKKEVRKLISVPNNGQYNEYYPNPTFSGAMKSVLEQLDKSYKERAYASEGSDDSMDEGTRKLIDRIDQDFRDHKREMSSRDARILSEFQEREKRIHDESLEREKRLFDLVYGVKADIKDSLQQTNSNIDSFKAEMNSKLDKIESKANGSYWHTTAIVVATIALVISAIAIIINKS